MKNKETNPKSKEEAIKIVDRIFPLAKEPCMMECAIEQGILVGKSTRQKEILDIIEKLIETRK
jgi:hypothetical protein